MSTHNELLAIKDRIIRKATELGFNNVTAVLAVPLADEPLVRNICVDNETHSIQADKCKILQDYIMSMLPLNSLQINVMPSVSIIIMPFVVQLDLGQIGEDSNHTKFADYITT